MKLKMLLTCISLSSGLLLTSPVMAGNMGNNQIDKMQQHWQMVISEKDVNKRKMLINEHKTMMNEMDKSNSGHHMNNMSGHHMNNVMDMHRSMIHMMD